MVLVVVLAERRSVCIVATGRALHTTGFILHLNWSCLDWEKRLLHTANDGDALGLRRKRKQIAQISRAGKGVVP